MAVLAQEQDEQEGADALVAVGEGVVLDHEVEQVRGRLLDARVERLAVEGLLDGAQDAWRVARRVP